jgi:Mg-chelatase subunit ChlD
MYFTLEDPTLRSRTVRPDCDSGGAPFLALGLIDISPSMLIQDWVPSRLAAAVDAACRFVQVAAQQNSRNRVAVVAFDRFAQIISPFVPAADGELTERIRAVRTGTYTSITAGLLAAETLFQTTPADPAPGRLLLLLTDGAHNTGPEPYDVATRLKRGGVRIQTIGIASEQAVNAVMLKGLASNRADGQPDYRFIGDRQRLVEHFEHVARRLTL